MMKKPLRILLVSTPGPVCDATCLTILNTTNTKLAALASGALSATQLLQLIPTDFVLLDVTLPDDEMIALLQWIQEHCQQVRTVVATLTSEQMQRARALGADEVVLRDELPGRIRVMVDEMFDATR